MLFGPTARNDRSTRASACVARVQSVLLLGLLGVAGPTALAGAFAAAASASPSTAYVTNQGVNSVTPIEVATNSPGSVGPINAPSLRQR